MPGTHSVMERIWTYFSLLNYGILVNFEVGDVIVFSDIPTNESSWFQWIGLNAGSFMISWVNSKNHKRKQNCMSKGKVHKEGSCQEGGGKGSKDKCWE